MFEFDFGMHTPTMSHQNPIIIPANANTLIIEHAPALFFDYYVMRLDLISCHQHHHSKFNHTIILDGNMAVMIIPPAPHSYRHILYTAISLE
jgi:hypothetical protein